jgi:integrase
LVDARQYKAMLISDRRRNKTAKTMVLGQMIFSVYWKEWMEECRGSVSEGWRREQERIGDVYILPRLGSMPLSEIASRDIGAVIEAARKKGRGPGMLRHVYNVLHKAFEDAIEHFEYLERSPVIRRYCPKVPRKNRSYLHPRESTKLLMHVKGHFLEPAIMLGLMAGLRPSEIQALTWKNVDLENGQIIICAAYKRRPNKIEPFPKQKDFGQATTPKPLLDFLRELSVGKSETDFVAPGQQGRMLHYHVLRKLLPELCKAAGVRIITPHELRHSATELWVFNGATQTDVGRQLNHANDSTTERYMHRTNDRLEAIGESFVLPGYSANNEQGRPALRLIPRDSWDVF